ncbi:MAG: response regulator [Lachnospiraceae bacterium]|nr:response regulator [Lachnospiraceae bacterium]
MGQFWIVLQIISACLILTLLVGIYIYNRRNRFGNVSYRGFGVFDIIDEPVVVMDKDLRFVYANKCAKKKISYFEKLKPGDTLEGKYNELFIYSENTEIRLENRSFYKRTEQLYKKNAKLAGYLLYLIDITVEQNKISKLRESNDKLSRENASKNEFFAMANYELRTPMNAIWGYTELLLHQVEDGKIRKNVQQIRNSVNTLINTVSGIRDYTLLSEDGKCIVENEYALGNFVERIEDVLKVVADQNGVVLSCELDEKLPSVLYGDSVHIHQIILNIINWMLVSQCKGEYQIVFSGHKVSEDYLELAISIRNSNSGLPADEYRRLCDQLRHIDTWEVSEKISQNFAKGNADFEREMALSLSVTASLLSNIGGSVFFESEVGDKTSKEQSAKDNLSFTIVLIQKLISQVSVRQYREAMQGVNDLNKNRIYVPDAKILVVDDNEMNADVLIQNLSLFGIRADFAENGLKAVDMTDDKLYHMVIMDYMMPGLDGAETLRKIRMHSEWNRNMPVLALTANALEGTKEYLLKMGFQEYVNKPMTVGLLERFLQKYLPDEILMERVYVDSYDLSSVGLPKEFAIEGLDVESGMSNCASNTELYVKTIEMILQYVPGKINALMKYWEENNLELFTIEVHALKSNTLAIGALELSERSKKLEEAGRNEDRNYIANELKEYYDAMSAFIDKLNIALEAYYGAIA